MRSGVPDERASPAPNVAPVMMSPGISRINDQHLGQSEHVVNHIRYGNAILGNQIWITTVKLPQCRLQPRREKTLWQENHDN